MWVRDMFRCCTLAPLIIIINGTPERIHLVPPTESEEDTWSPNVPEDLKCDACRLISLLLSKKFNKVTKNRTKALPESDILDAVDAVCLDKDSNFEKYGFTDTGGTRKLTGPDFQESDFGDMIIVHDVWSTRFRRTCLDYVGVLEEEEVFRAWFTGDDRTLERFFCENELTHNVCDPRTGRRKQEGKKKTRETDKNKL